MQIKESVRTEGRTLEIIQSEEQKDKRTKKSEESLWELQDTIKRNNAHFMKITEGKEKKGRESILKIIMTENSPNLGTWTFRSMRSKRPQIG